MHQPKPNLDRQHHLRTIHTQPEFAHSLPRESFNELPQQERRVHLRNAVATGALAAAERAERDRTRHELDGQLLRLTGTLHTFEAAQRTVDNLRDKHPNARTMDKEERESFRHNKKEVRKFNDALRGVINVGTNYFSFDELINFMTNNYAATAGENVDAFREFARSALVGARGEVGFEQGLIAADIEYDEGDDETDSKGGDVVVDNVRIDVKSSPRSAQKAKARAAAQGYNPDRIIWSHINPEDFEGRLTLPYHKVHDLGEKIRPEIERAVASEKRRQRNTRTA